MEECCGTGTSIDVSVPGERIHGRGGPQALNIRAAVGIVAVKQREMGVDSVVGTGSPLRCVQGWVHRKRETPDPERQTRPERAASARNLASRRRN